MSKEWVYRYDDEGRRIGLVELPEDEARPIKKAGMTAWYVPIENEVLKRDPFLWHHTTITPLERDMQKYELKALRDNRHRPFSSRIKTIQSVRYTEAGYRVIDEYDIVSQDTPYILSTIHKLLGSTGRIISFRQIRGILQDISDIYVASDVQDKPVTLQISHYTRKRLRNELQRGA